MKQSKYKYIAHSENSNGAEQSMKQHSESVAELMRSFALADDFAEIYSYCGLLHDIGKSFQYRQQIPHEIAGERIARRILDSLPTGFTFTDEEKALICLAVRGHRRRHEHMEPEIVCCDMHPKYNSVMVAEELGLPVVKVQHHYAHILSCMAEKKCNWNEEEKNMEIII